MPKKNLRIVFGTIAAILTGIVLILAFRFHRLSVLSAVINDDFTSVYDDEKYQNAVCADGVEVITQDVSCGYAVIEMFSKWDGGNVTEKTLYDEYGKVVTSTGKAFYKEMNKRFPNHTTTMRSYLMNSEMIDVIYDSLSRGTPVPFEWAAKYEDQWTLHYSLVIGLDVPNDTIRVANPYGFYEDLSLEEFLNRTRYDAYEKMPVFLKMGFAFGLFEKNTVFVVE